LSAKIWGIAIHLEIVSAATSNKFCCQINWGFFQKSGSIFVSWDNVYIVHPGGLVGGRFESKDKIFLDLENLITTGLLDN
jgi:hypothetical protein